MNQIERKKLEEKLAIKLELKKRKLEKRQNEFSIYAIIDENKKIIKNYQDSVNGLKEISIEIEPTIFIPKILEKLVTTKKDYKIIIGGRGSGKSVTVNKILACKAKDHKLKVACFREFMNSISDSTYSSLIEEINELGFTNFDITNTTISSKKGSEFIFKGLARNIESIKSMNSVKLAFTDEAQTISDESIKVLKPTIRANGSELWFVGNPKSSADAFSKEFIIPYQKQLDKNGYYEDDEILVIVCNYKDNPFFPEKLERDRLKDYENLPRAVYDWIWLGKFNDTVDNSIIQVEWFDAAIDMHKNPKFAQSMKPKGAIISAYDVADTGDDDKAYSCRHGSIIKNVKSKSDGDISDGAQWAISNAISDNCDIFTFDASGMGVGIRKEVNEGFNCKKIQVDEHRGGDCPDNADKVFEGFDVFNKKTSKTNKEIFKNKRAQFIWRLRDRFYNSYKAVVKGEYINLDDCISLDSETIENIDALRSEICRQPLKETTNGVIQMMSKQDMKKIGISSPNLLDAVAMTMMIPTPKKKKNQKIDYQKVNTV
jgi:phage terminase large subunit